MQKTQRQAKYWSLTSTLSLFAVGLFLALISFIHVITGPDYLWHPGREAELIATYEAYQDTGTLLIKETGSGSYGAQAPSEGEYSSGAWDDDPGMYIFSALLGDITQSASPYPGLRAAQALLVALPMIWLPFAVARVFRKPIAGYALVVLPLMMFVLNGTILTGTMYGLSDSIATLPVYAMYGIGASLTFFSLSLLLLLSTYSFKLPGLLIITVAFGFLAGAGNLTRSLSGVGIALAVGLIWWLNITWRPKTIISLAGPLLALLIAVGLTTTTMNVLNIERARATGQDMNELPDSHGTWHPLYLGLSYPEPITGEPSALGITWADEYGWEVAREVNPSVVIAGEEYDFIMRDAFWDAVSKQPLDALSTYFQKLLYVITSFGLMIVFIIIGFWAGLRRKGIHRKSLLIGGLIAAPTFLISLVPPVLVMPMLYYFSDIAASLGLLVTLSLGSIAWAASIFVKKRKANSAHHEKTEAGAAK